MSQRQLHLVLEFGALRPSWTWKEKGQPYSRLPSFHDFLGMARQAEEAHFDAVFFADFLGLDRIKLARRATIPFEPQTLLAALAAMTSRIGLISTQSTLFNYPFNVARMFASLDHLSEGRAGWNIVTSFNGEKNYGMDTIPSPEERYAAAQEFVDVVLALWDSWEPGANIADPGNPVYVDVSKVHDVNFAGERYRVAEALDLPRPVQGRPVLVQAGASEVGLNFAARNAEVVFVASPTIDHGLEFSTNLRKRVVDAGRPADALRILPGLRIVIAETEAEAWRLQASQGSDTELSGIRKRMETEVEGLDLGGLDLDAPIPPERFPSPEEIAKFGRRRSRAVLIREIALGEGVTLRSFLHKMQGAGAHLEMVGTPKQIAAEMEQWLTSKAADGFMLGSGIGHDLFFSEVVPELVRRGIFRSAYHGNTLRDHLGLAEPA